MKQRWKKRKAPISHADDWLMTYADMITLLLCFFAVFLTVSMPKQEIPKPVQVQRAVVPDVLGLPVPDLAVQALPQQPEAIKGNLPFYDREPEDAAVKPLDDKTLPEDSIVTNEKTKTAMPKTKDNLKKEMASDKDEKGDRITTIEMNSAAFFDSGSATLSASGKDILKNVAVTIKSDKFKDYQVTVEGHTDDSPIDTAQFPSNWELSTARASAVVRFFLDLGIRAERLRAAGYADTFPKAPNRDAAGKPVPENQSRNRRVVIKLEKIQKGTESLLASSISSLPD